MAFKKAMTVGQVQKCNVAAFKSWLKSNAKKIAPKAGKAVFYTGDSIGLLIKKIEDVHAEQSKSVKGESAADKKRRIAEAKELKTGVWSVLEGVQKGIAKLNVPDDFEDIVTVLKRIKSHPILIDRDHNEISFSHMSEYMDEVKRKVDVFPKPYVAQAWTTLSHHFAENAKGDISILDGVEDDFRTVGGHKDFVSRELPALLKNKSLSKETRLKLEKLVGKYMSKFDSEVKKLAKKALSESKKLKKHN